MAKGFTNINDNLYYFDEQKGFLKIGFNVDLNGNHYYSDENGVVNRNGWWEMDGYKYYSDSETGVLGNGITTIGENQYHFGENSNQLKYGFSVTLNNKHYYSNEDGIIQKLGWWEMDGNKYYSDPETGVLGNGITTIGENQYHFGENSNQLKYGFSKLLNGLRYYSDENGVILKGIQKIDGNLYHFGEISGQLKLGWSQTLNGNKYYSDLESGVIYTGSLLIGHTFCTFDENGVLISSSSKKYIDVSAWQGNIDWIKVMSGNVDGAIIRVGYGTSNSEPCTLDKYFERNYTSTAFNNFLKGIYLYSYAVSPENAISEADFVIAQLRIHNVGRSIPIFYDLESNNLTSNVTPEMYDLLIKTFINRLNSAGYPNVSVYTYKYLAENKFTDYGRSQVTWIAQYNDVNTYKGSYNGWQYTSSAFVDGISGPVDMSVFR